MSHCFLSYPDRCQVFAEISPLGLSQGVTSGDFLLTPTVLWKGNSMVWPLLFNIGIPNRLPLPSVTVVIRVAKPCLPT